MGLREAGREAIADLRFAEWGQRPGYGPEVLLRRFVRAVERPEEHARHKRAVEALRRFR